MDELQAGDIVCCRLRLNPREEHLLLDLVERGITLIPSATSQLASRSKVFQARIFHPMMLTGTTAIYDIHGLLGAISLYKKAAIDRVILKQNRKNGGLGIHLFKDSEDIFTLAANNLIPFPFVLQPFIADSRDIRVIILGDYIEAYERINPDNFRKNLHCGGRATPLTLSEEQISLCRQVMIRGAFPYAHIDIMLTDDNTAYLTEINLRGGIRGAAVSPQEYGKKIKTINNILLQNTLQ